MAIEQFSILKNEIQVMDERKKDAIYELGCCHESMGSKEKAFEEFKAVYSADISFRDVAEKINAFYQQKAPSSEWMAEREGFEPPVPFGTPDFESGTFDHSATSPENCKNSLKIPILLVEYYN